MNVPREELIDLLVYFIEEVEDAIVAPAYFESYTNEELKKEVCWYQYLMDK